MSELSCALEGKPWGERETVTTRHNTHKQEGAGVWVLVEIREWRRHSKYVGTDHTVEEFRGENKKGRKDTGEG